jgi:hypothetical protein
MSYEAKSSLIFFSSVLFFLSIDDFLIIAKISGSFFKLLSIIYIAELPCFTAAKAIFLSFLNFSSA